MLRKIAHNSTIPSIVGNKDLKPLQDLISAEKTVLATLQKFSVDLTKASEALRNWGLGEGDDLGDILSASNAILSHFSNALTQYSTHEGTIREHLKAIRTREENLDELRRRKKAVTAKADTADKKMSKMSPENKNWASQTDILNKLRDEIRTLDGEILQEEAHIGDFKRKSIRTILGLKFGGLEEISLKGSVIGKFGKHIALEIPQDVTQPGQSRAYYQGYGRTEWATGEVNRAVDNIFYMGLDQVPHDTVSSPQEPLIPGRAYNEAPEISFSTGAEYSGIAEGSPAVVGMYQNHSGQNSSPNTYASSYIAQASQLPMSVTMTNSRHESPQISPHINASNLSLFSQPVVPGITSTPTPLAYDGQGNPWDAVPSPGQQSPARAMDDFGFVSRPGQGSGSGGRFATFPNRPAGMISRDSGPSEAMKFAASNQNEFSTPIPLDPAPSYNTFSQITPQNVPTISSTPVTSASQQVPLASVWSDAGDSPGRNSFGDTSLAYADPGRSSLDSDDQHVRFGEVNDVEEELDRRRRSGDDGALRESMSSPIYGMDSNEAASHDQLEPAHTLSALAPEVTAPAQERLGASELQTIQPATSAGVPSPVVPPSSFPQGSIRVATAELNPRSSLSSHGHGENISSHSQGHESDRANSPRSPGGPMTKPDMAGPFQASPSSSSKDFRSQTDNAPYRPIISPLTVRPPSSQKITTNSNGPRTISAAAFKRAPPRAAVPLDAGGSPASLQQKKSLPESPHPVSRRIADDAYPLRSTVGTPSEYRPSMEGEESFDYISAYVSQMDNVEDPPRLPTNQ